MSTHAYGFKPRWPNMLFALIIGSLVSLLLNGEQNGVRLVGELPCADLRHPRVGGLSQERHRAGEPDDHEEEDPRHERGDGCVHVRCKVGFTPQV